MVMQIEAPASREAVKRRALSAIGRFRSGPADLSTEHDKYLEETYGVSRKPPLCPAINRRAKNRAP